MLKELARLLGLSRDDAEASMYSERAAMHVLQRRDMLKLSAAMCAGTLFADVPLIVEAPFAGVNRYPLTSFNAYLKQMYPLGRINEALLRRTVDGLLVP